MSVGGCKGKGNENKNKSTSRMSEQCHLGYFLFVFDDFQRWSAIFNIVSHTHVTYTRQTVTVRLSPKKKKEKEARVEFGDFMQLNSPLPVQ